MWRVLAASVRRSGGHTASIAGGADSWRSFGEGRRARRHPSIHRRRVARQAEQRSLRDRRSSSVAQLGPWALPSQRSFCQQIPESKGGRALERQMQGGRNARGEEYRRTFALGLGGGARVRMHGACAAVCRCTMHRVGPTSQLRGGAAAREWTVNCLSSPWSADGSGCSTHMKPSRNPKASAVPRHGARLTARASR
jgi:hypothetical protein